MRHGIASLRFAAPRGPPYARAMTSTVGGALRAAIERLATAGLPASDAEELLSRLLGVGRGDLRRRATDPLAPEAQATFDRHLTRRLAGEPVQYVTGRAAFRHLDLVVDPRVLIPRPETELLVEAVLDHLAGGDWSRRPPRVLDLGTGSGCIALAVASERADALAVATVNAQELGLTDRVTFAHGHWFAAVEPDDRFDVIVSNPPYIAWSEAVDLPADVREHEPHPALFADDDGLADLRTIVDEAPRHLLAGGLLALELAEMRAEAVAAWLEGAHDWQSVELRDDLAGRPRMLLARRERGPAIAPAQWGEEG